METTPLQLYIKAYNLHYEDNNFNEARSIYRQLINDYHGSDIADYASIQLSELAKLQNENRGKAPVAQQNNFNRLLIAFIIINFILIAGIIAFFTGKLNKYNSDLSTMSKISQVYAKLYTGKENDAFKILNEVKINNKNDITPYAISADIHLKNNDFIKAKNEYEIFQKLSPENALDKEVVKNISMAEELYKIALQKAAKSQDTSSIEERIADGGEGADKVTEQKKRIIEEDEAEPEIINKENVSYF